MKSGNVNQVAAFGKLVGICNDLGARYNPSKAALMPTALATLHEQAQQSLEAVTVAHINYMLVINRRQERYAGIYPLVARVVRALSSSGTSAANLQDARMIRRKLSSRPVPVMETTDANGEEGIQQPSRTISYLDFQSKATVFSSFINLMERIPSYLPNEKELQVSALRETLAEMKSVSVEVAQAANALANARMHRNEVMLGKGGMNETGNAVKEYIRSVFGVRSEPARELGKLRFAA
jgi:hypothetical protein